MLGKQKGKLVIIILFFMILIVICVIIAPRPIIEDNLVKVIIAEYNNGYNNRRMELIDISDQSDEIIAILEKYKESMGFSIAKGYNFADVEFRITLMYGGGFKEILLGTNNYSYRGVGKAKYIIVHSEKLLQELRKLVK